MPKIPLELWKSTLTEEQLELSTKLDTLVAPANVSHPRRWRICPFSGTTINRTKRHKHCLIVVSLSTPEHLAAATFTDTFDLGEKTNINLLSNGTATFAGSIFVGDEVTSLRQTVNFQGGKSGPVFKVFEGEQTDSGGDPSIALNSDGSAEFDADVNARYGAFGTDIDNRSVVKIGGDPAGGASGAAVNSAMLRIEPTFSQPDSGGIAAAVQAIITNPPGDFAAGTENYRCITATGGAGANNSPENGFGFFADQSLVNTGTANNYGFYSNLEADGDKNFNFFAGNTAPNYFEGKINTNDLITVKSGTFNAGNADEDPAQGYVNIRATTGLVGLGTYCDYVATGNVDSQRFYRYTSADSDAAPSIYGRISVTESGGIQIKSENDVDPVFVVNSDARVKTLTPFPSNAADVVSQLNPGVNGFIAHELQAQVSDAVTGTQDATEAIGTLADYDGTVLATEVTEPAELTYTKDVTDSEGVTTQVVRTRTWTATGTRPVYQGVDQTKLIPLLTKALQEALERIEALENA